MGLLDHLNIKRPTMLLDRKKVDLNLDFMTERARKAGVRFRPHFKTHQSAEIGSWFRQRGIDKISVSSLGMARYFADAGWNDITVAFPVNRLETDLINDLAGRIKLNLLVDHPEIVAFLEARLQHPVDIWIKVDTGYGRVGIEWKEEERVLSVVKTIKKAARFRFAGLLAHAGHCYDASSVSEIKSIHEETVSRLVGLKNMLLSKGFPCEVSVGDTPSCSVVEEFGEVDELRPGNFVFYDLDQLHIGSCGTDQIALVLACPVVGKYPKRGHILIYGGSVHFSRDYVRDKNKDKVYGQLVSQDTESWGKPEEGAHLFSLSQEHGKLKVDQELFDRTEVGDILLFLPVHSCLTSNLHRSYLTLEGEVITRFNSLP